jgi:hypothetical protein
MMHRRDFIKAGGAVAVLGGLGTRAIKADVPDHLWSGYDFGPAPKVIDRLNQGPFGVEQDRGLYTIFNTTPSEEPIKNYGLGLVGYTWEENGPSIAARGKKETLEQHVEKLASLPFMDNLYIRCDWRDIQQKAGRLDFSPVWKLTMEAAKAYNLKVGFRIQLSSPNIQPGLLSMPDFLQEKVPIVNIGPRPNKANKKDFREPRYDHPEFKKAFRELNELLAAEFDNDPLVEFMDLMMYGFWGEGHTGWGEGPGVLPNPFPNYLTAERTFVEMTQLQLDVWEKVPLVVGMQPDISQTGNREVQDMAVRNGCWLRSDSIISDEPIQIEMLADRPPWLPVIIEDGENRAHNIDTGNFELDSAGLDYRTQAGLHALDVGSNYWGLWTEADNLKEYYEKFPYSFNTLKKRLGYRIRPSWICQRKRYETAELVVTFCNDGVAGVPGVLRVSVESLDGKVKITGGLDAGHPYGGKIRQASFVLPPEMIGQKMLIKAEIETKGGIRRPIKWACAQKLNADGSLSFQLLSEVPR